MNDGEPNRDISSLVERGYDQVTSAYARLESSEPWPRMRWVDRLLAHLPADSAVLDLGCGNGDPADVAVARNHHVTGVDISHRQIEEAQRRVPSGTFIHSDLLQLTFPPESFDAVMSFYTLEHLPRSEHQSVLTSIHRWLKPGGYVLLSIEAAEFDDVTGDWLGVPMFFSSYGPTKTVELFKDVGFEIVETATESQRESDHDISYLWVLGRKRGG